MDTKELKVIAATTVIKSKLPKDSKIQLLNFIQNEATKYQLMAFLMDGKISKVSKISESIIEDRFKVVYEKKMNVIQKAIANCKSKGKEFKGCMKKFFAGLRASKKK